MRKFFKDGKTDMTSNPVVLRWPRKARPSKGDGQNRKKNGRSSFEARLRSHLRMTEYIQRKIIAL
jgi:hypothetical protein